MAITSEDFHKHLRSTLNHLYNPDYLRDSLFASLMGLEGQFNTPKTLQEILINAIEKVKDKPIGPADSQPTFYYDLLYYRYVQKLTQEEVANQLGVSTRQFAREQDRAIDLLTNQLLEKYTSLSNAVTGFVKGTRSSARLENTEFEDDLSWLEKNYSSQPIELSKEVETVLGLVIPLASQHHILIETDLDPHLPDLAVHPVAFRQALLSIINVAIHQAGRETILIKANISGKMIKTSVDAVRTATPTTMSISAEDQNSLEMAEKFIDRNKGSMNVQESIEHFIVDLSLPAFLHHVILLIDDNQDFHELVQRYTFGTRYQMVNTTDPNEAFDLAGKHAVQLILLDVMMPEIDGWQVLGQLRRNPKTSQIPVVICTIIAQEELAYSLGASAFLRKPVTRQMLIETLDRLLTGTEAQGSD